MAAEFPEKVNESTAGTKPMTNERVYLLMSVADGKIGQVTRILRRRSSITLIDELEGPPDLLFTIEAPTREALANLTMNVVADIDALAEDFQVLPSCQSTVTAGQRRNTNGTDTRAAEQM